MESQHCLTSTSFIICGASYIIRTAFLIIWSAFVVCGISFYYILCVDISAIKPLLKNDTREVIYHFTAVK